jgi:hypothetical protein
MTPQRHPVTLICGGQVRHASLTSDEAEELWAYAKGLCLPVTVLRMTSLGVQWCQTGRDLPEEISVVTTTEQQLTK